MNKENHSDIWVTVLHYQDAERSKSCLASIHKLLYQPFNILITDNCSPDQSGKELCLAFPDCHYLELPDNLGFAGGANASVNYCLERGASWVWLLNNDTELEADSLSRLLEAAGQDEGAGILGATVYTPHAGGYSRSGTGIFDFRRAKTLERGNIDETARTIACEWISGCNMLFRSTAFKELGGFDENYFLYFEDADLCWRMNQAGWKCLLVPAAKIRHTGTASTPGKLSIWRSYYYTRNRLLFFLKARRGAASIPVLLAVSAHILRHLLVLPFRGESGRRQLRAELLGIRDYFSNRLGKASCLDF
jgi:GT2 family glycosyltransferase